MVDNFETLSFTDFPIRKPYSGLEGERDAYLYHVQNPFLPEIPTDMERFRGKMNWPMDMKDPKVHIAKYFEPGNYAIVDYPHPHTGIDIQAAAGTKVLAPMRLGQIVDYRVYDERRPKGVPYPTAYLHIKEHKGPVHIFEHLDAASIPEELRQIGAGVSADTVIGTVAHFYELKSGIAVPAAVGKEYGRRFDHLHYAIEHNHQRIDPLLLLKRLY
jgi:murein DD-endopeptidase MepM/ murein hydrolase activator NlpD